MTAEEIIKFSKEIYGGTTYSHKMKLVAYNENYILMQKPPSTEYVGRVSGSVYSESEWFLISVLERNNKELNYSPDRVSAFYRKGKLSKEDKQLLKEKYNIDFPKKERSKKETATIWIILYKKNEFWGTYRKDFFKFYRLLRQNETSIFIQTNSGQERMLSKSMYTIAYFKDDKEALNSFLKLERLANEYNEQKKLLEAKSKEIGSVFSNNSELKSTKDGI